MGVRRFGLLAYVSVTVLLIGFANFFWEDLESTARGGSALNGYHADGHYFVGSHGKFTEVDQATWEWSRAHEISVWITHVLAFAGTIYLVKRVVPALRARRTS